MDYICEICGKEESGDVDFVRCDECESLICGDCASENDNMCMVECPSCGGHLSTVDADEDDYESDDEEDED